MAKLGALIGWLRLQWLSSWVLALVIASGLLTACELPQVTAEERLFLNLSLEFLDAYKLPSLDVEKSRVGGISALTYDRQRDRFYALSDDRGEFAPPRFYTLRLDVNTADAQHPRLKQVTVEGVTFLHDKDGNPYPKGVLDPEGLSLSPLRSLFVSSEGDIQGGIPPSVQEFDLETGNWRRDLPVPQRYAPDPSDPPQPQGIQNNLGFESLTTNPGGYGSTGVEPFRLFTATESTLLQDIDLNNPGQTGRSRMLHYLLEEGRSLLLSEHLYPLDLMPLGTLLSGLVELLAIDQGGHFLSLERYAGTSGFGGRIFQLTLGGATDTSTIASLKEPLKGVEPVHKKLLLDLSDLGIPLDNLEGMTLGPQLPDGSQSLVLVSDDNFKPEQVTQFLLFRLKKGG